MVTIGTMSKIQYFVGKKYGILSAVFEGLIYAATVQL